MNSYNSLQNAELHIQYAASHSADRKVLHETTEDAHFSSYQYCTLITVTPIDREISYSCHKVLC